MNAPMDLLEAFVFMLPREAGGRATVVSPRDGSYRPFVRAGADEPMIRIRFIEGPPLLGPGDSARVVVEVEASDVPLAPGCELDLFEQDLHQVGIISVSRVWRAA